MNSPLTLPRFHRVVSDQRGFTLVEILIVVIILGALAGIGITAFLSQRSKGTDVEAKSGVKLAAKTIETCATENDGAYNKSGGPCDKPALVAIEPSLNDLGTRLRDPVLGNDTYTLTVESERSPANVRFSIERLANGELEYDCAVGVEDKGGCPNPGGAGDDW